MNMQVTRCLMLWLLQPLLSFEANALNERETWLRKDSLLSSNRELRRTGDDEYFRKRGTKERISQNDFPDFRYNNIDSKYFLSQKNERKLPHNDFPAHRNELSFEDDCPHLLNMGLNENTGSFGNMFDVQAKGSPIKITSLDFYTDLKHVVSYEVWSKLGSFEGYRGDIGAWEKLSEGSIEGQGRGRGTRIPVDNFLSVIIEGGETRAFYITLTTPDIRYAYGQGYSAGEKVDKENDHLYVFEGVGVASYPFDKEHYNEPRRFLGGFQYSTIEPCLVPTKNPTLNPKNTLLLSSVNFPTQVPTIYPTLFPTTIPTALQASPRPVEKVTETMLQMSQIEYINQLIHPFAEPVDFISQSVSESIEKTIKNVISENATVLNMFARESELEIESITSSFDGALLSDAQCTTTIVSSTCSQINTLIVMSHSNHLKSESVRHEILKVAKEASYDLPYTAYYKGVEAISAKTIISLRGLTRLMSKDDSNLFESELKSFLSSSFVKNGVVVTGFQIVDQQLSTKGRILSNLNNESMMQKSQPRVLQTSSSLEVTVIVTGEHTPPPDLNFDTLVSDTINNNDEKIIRSLQTKNSNYFEKVQEMSARPETIYGPTLEPEMNETEKPEGNPVKQSVETPTSKKSKTGLIVGLCISFVMLGFAIAGYIFFKGVKESDGDSKGEVDDVFKNLSEGHSQEIRITGKLDFMRKMRRCHVGCDKNEKNPESGDVENNQLLQNIGRFSSHSVTEEVSRKRSNSECH